MVKYFFLSGTSSGVARIFQQGAKASRIERGEGVPPLPWWWDFLKFVYQNGIFFAHEMSLLGVDYLY